MGSAKKLVKTVFSPLGLVGSEGLKMVKGKPKDTLAGNLIPDEIIPDEKKKTKLAATNYEDLLTEISKMLFESTAPMRDSLIGDLTSVAEGTFDPKTSASYNPLFAEAKGGIEDQYGVAKENIISSLPRGGGMERALTEVETGRAETSAELPAQLSKNIMDDMMSKAYGVAFGTPQTSLQGIGAASNTFGTRQAAEMAAESQEQAAKFGGLGQMAGMAATAAMSKCWVASVIYGPKSSRTMRARFYCLTHDNWFLKLYGKYGKRWAKYLENHRWLTPIVKPMWAYMAYKGKSEVTLWQDQGTSSRA